MQVKMWVAFRAAIGYQTSLDSNVCRVHTPVELDVAGFPPQAPSYWGYTPTDHRWQSCRGRTVVADDDNDSRRCALCLLLRITARGSKRRNDGPKRRTRSDDVPFKEDLLEHMGITRGRAWQLTSSCRGCWPVNRKPCVHCWRIQCVKRWVKRSLGFGTD